MSLICSRVKTSDTGEEDGDGEGGSSGMVDPGVGLGSELVSVDSTRSVSLWSASVWESEWKPEGRCQSGRRHGRRSGQKKVR